MNRESRMLAGVSLVTVPMVMSKALRRKWYTQSISGAPF